ncbi:hypothetical protein QES_0247 [Clostridioides difficile CD149]|nr:hypothetical protein [Clostridioides difficile]WMU95235.1 hypothetical protein ADOKEBJH_00139 [Clostridioides phage AR1086-1]EIJ0743009.1 hypothetical protein [Clostridioides difficile]EJA6621381.1 hypothetical protein [Clostridioides difficile]EJA6645331.1 hypothetical protein [Clostridioides difficile]EJA6649361.1 hypothetical protein [Clostridioides difficile]
MEDIITTEMKNTFLNLSVNNQLEILNLAKTIKKIEDALNIEDNENYN